MKLTILTFLTSLMAVSQAAPAPSADVFSTVYIYASTLGETTDTATCYLPGAITKQNSKAYDYYNYVKSQAGATCQLVKSTEKAYCKFTVTKDIMGGLSGFLQDFGTQCGKDGGNYNNQLTPDGK